MLLQNKIAIVTGAGTGLGKAIALTLGKEGAKVAAFGRTPATIEKTVQEIRALNTEAIALRTDVAKNAEVVQAVQAVLEKWGRIDILVNNAAILPKTQAKGDLSNYNAVLDTTDEEWNEQIAVDLTGVFYCMKAVVKPMMAQKSGRIINIGSLSGLNGGYFSSTSYTASKAGVIGMTKLAARWLGKYGVNVNVVNPGPIMTEGADFAPAQKEALKRTIPFRRHGDDNDAFGKPQDIANAVLFLASPLSEFVTGTSVNVLGAQWVG